MHQRIAHYHTSQTHVTPVWHTEQEQYRAQRDTTWGGGEPKLSCVCKAFLLGVSKASSPPLSLLPPKRVSLPPKKQKSVQPAQVEQEYFQQLSCPFHRSVSHISVLSCSSCLFSSSSSSPPSFHPGWFTVCCLVVFSSCLSSFHQVLFFSEVCPLSHHTLFLPIFPVVCCLPMFSPCPPVPPPPPTESVCLFCFVSVFVFLFVFNRDRFFKTDMLTIPQFFPHT